MSISPLAIFGTLLLLLKGQVSKGARQVEGSVDSAGHDAASRSDNALEFSIVAGFVVEGERHCLSFTAQYSPRVARIGSDEHDAGSAAIAIAH